MHRTLILFAALLWPLAGVAQPPAPVGGDMSATTTKATGSTTARKLSDRAADWLDPRDFGAVGDGNSRLLTAGAPMLAQCPQLTAPVETDACAVQAALNAIATRPAVTNVAGTPGGGIRVRAGTTLKMGAQTVAINNASAALVGEDQLTSAILVGANPMLAFGLNNGMGIGAAVVASSGSGFVPGDLLTLTGLGGACTVNPVIGVLTVGSSGEILTHSISTPGNCPTPPTNPLDYTTPGGGYGAQYNGTWTAGALTNAIQITGTGTGCVNGEILTGAGGSTPGGTPRQFQLKVTNAVGGVVQAGGVSITDTGSYGRPPPNPVPVTGSAGCTGATFNVSKFSNSGGSLLLEKLQFIADGPAVSIVNAQTNVIAHSELFQDLAIWAPQGANNLYFNGGFNIYGGSLAAFQRIDARNNLTYLNSNPSAALFVLNSQNNMLGAYDYNWDQVSVAYYMGGGVDFISDAGDLGYQGINFHHFVCGLGAHCLRFENTGAHAFGKVVIDDLYSGQTTQSIEMKTGQNVTISNSGFNEGVTRVTTPPAQVDLVVLDGVNQWMIRGNVCGSALTVTPSVTCFHLKGTSSFGIASNNVFANTAKVPTFIGYVFDSAAGGNLQVNDIFIGAPTQLTPVQDSGAGNTTYNTPAAQTPCVNVTLTAGQTYQIPDYTQCVYATNALIANATLVMPVNNAPNQVVNFIAYGGITTMTLQVAGGSGQTLGGGMPTTLTNATPFSLKNIINRWERKV